MELECASLVFCSTNETANYVVKAKCGPVDVSVGILEHKQTVSIQSQVHLASGGVTAVFIICEISSMDKLSVLN